MKDLLSLTKRENCFYTVDGKTICTIKELHEYVNNCDPNSYAHHTSDGRNDFANWIRDVLLFNDLSNILFGTKTIDEARSEINKFTESFEYKTKNIPETAAFVTVDDYKLKNIQELYYYLINCDDANYLYHVTLDKNDFAKWVGDIWGLNGFSQKMFLVSNRGELISVLKDFLINGPSNNSREYSKYMSEKMLNEKDFDAADAINFNKTSLVNGIITDNTVNNVESIMLPNINAVSSNINSNTISTITPITTDVSSNNKYSSSTKNNSEIISTKVNLPEQVTSVSSNDDSIHTIYNAVNNKPVVGGLQDLDYTKNKISGVNNSNNITSINKTNNNNSSNNSLNEDGEKLNLQTLSLVKDDEDESQEQKTMLFDPSQFHSFSDEELEKFAKFAKPDKEIEEPSIRIEYLKTAYHELSNMIKELRRAEKDALIADLMLRSINPKIDYYALTKNPDDYNHIIRIMKDVQKEIEDASVQQQYNIAEEIFKELRLQGMAMKKA